MKDDPKNVRTLIREWHKLDIDNHVILRRRTTSHVQLVLPKQFIPVVLKELHVEMGHLGVQHATRRPVLLPRRSTMSSFPDLVFQRGYTMIKVASLKTNCFITSNV